MTEVELRNETDFTGWRDRSRALIAAGIPPEEIIWRVSSHTRDLFAIWPNTEDGAHLSPPQGRSELRVPRRFVELAETVICHRDPHRFAVLYEVLWRIARGEPKLLAIA
ncbi:MAG: UdgX family uracil-DNA binding protein, partial [Methylocystis sp.]